MSLVTRIRDMSKKEKIVVSSIAVVIVLAVAATIAVIANNRYLATTMRLLRVEGTVNIEDSTGAVKPVIDNIRFESGDALSTGSDGLASVGLDDTKIVTLENDSRVEFQKHDKQLELTLTQGALFFEVTEKLADDETYEIKTSNMTVGIRGTSGYVYYSESGLQSLIITDGVVKVTGYNPKTQETKVVEVRGGESVTTYLYDESTEDRDSIEFEIKEVPVSELPEFPLQMLAENPALLEKVCEDTGWDKDELLTLVTALTDTKNPTPTPDAIIEITDTPTPTKKPKALVTVTPTPTGTATPSPSTKPLATATGTPAPGTTSTPGSSTKTPSATPNNVATPTPTVTVKPTTTPTATPTNKPTTSATPTDEPKPGPSIPAAYSGYSKFIWGESDDYGHDNAYIISSNGSYDGTLYAYLGTDGWVQVYYREYYGADAIGLICGYFFDDDMDTDVATVDDAYYVMNILEETGPFIEPTLPDGFTKVDECWGMSYENHSVYICSGTITSERVEGDTVSGVSYEGYLGWIDFEWKELTKTRGEIYYVEGLTTQDVFFYLPDDSLYYVYADHPIINVIVPTSGDTGIVNVIVPENTEPALPNSSYSKVENAWGTSYDGHTVYMCLYESSSSGGTPDDPENGLYGSSFVMHIVEYYGYVSGNWIELSTEYKLNDQTGEYSNYYYYNNSDNAKVIYFVS